MRSTWIAALLLLCALPAGAQERTAADDQLATAHYRQGWELLAAESWAEAAREFQAAVDINPEFKLAYYGLGRADMGDKKFGAAISAYERCRGLFEAQASRNFTNKADAERVIADDVMQLNMTISRLAAGPQSPSVAAQLAQLRMQKQRLEQKTRGTDVMSLTSPTPAFVELALGSAYLRSERFPDAEEAYKRAVALDPKYGEAHSNLAVLYLLTGRYDQAAASVKAAEKTGFHVNPALKEDIAKKQKGS
jgi:tetratricopeptide (TPR) repeat protein